MRGLVVVLLDCWLGCLLGCDFGSPVQDAGIDRAPASFEQPVGNACDAEESLLCARGAGICHGGVCCAFCSAAATPHCPDGMMEIHQTSDGREVCLCATE